MSSEERAPRNTLSRERVVTGAMEVADRDGLAALTIRSLATHLAVKPMALYHYVANKEELLDALVEQVFAEMTRPVPGGDWRAQLAIRAGSARATLVRHPWSLGLLETRTSPDRPSTLQHHESVMATLRAAGCSPALTARSYLLLDSYVYGFALQEVTMPVTDTMSEEAVAMAATMDPADYPHLVEVMTEHVMSPGYTMDDQFARGLDLVLDGIGRWLDAEQAEVPTSG